MGAEDKIKHFRDKWSCFWVTNKNRAKLDAAFEREIKELLDAEYNQALEDAVAHGEVKRVVNSTKAQGKGVGGGIWVEYVIDKELILKLKRK